jgi:hypothetical protein
MRLKPIGVTRRRDPGEMDRDDLPTPRGVAVRVRQAGAGSRS